ncbi:S8 family serine peptidase [Gottfriedia acidiceleris]|uniref:S8 family serine peptidase n=1 Tax=Gottfriedia acidiceleris TaxID=371036 RepID=UPI000B42FDBB|nr:S8 family serine peptidase [Gottfriedia acidiceleris]
MKKKNYLALPVSTILLFSSIYSGTVQAASVTGANRTVTNQVNSGKNLRKSQMKEAPKASSKVLPKKAETELEKKLRDKLKNKQAVKKRDYQTGELIVKYKKKVTTGEITSLQKKYSLKSSKKLKNLNAELVKIPTGESTSEYITKLKKDPNVESVQPNYKYYASDFNNANDYYDQLWGLNNYGQTINDSIGKKDIDVDAPESWTNFSSKLAKPEAQVVVGVIDTGVDINHPDLAGKIWKNPKEIPNNKIDDDHNGYVDDVNGWDFYNHDNTVYDALDGDEHGTHVSGTIAAAIEGTNLKDNKGVVGVAPNVKILPLKFIGPFGGTSADAIEAIEYAKSMGVKITNNSWGGGEYDPLLEEAIENSNSLFVAAAGNDGMDNDEEGAYPASFESANILSVAAVDNKGNLAPFSNYGADSVDVAAPGVDIISSVPKYPIDEITKLLKINQAGASAQINGDNYKAIFDGIGYEKISEKQRQDAFDKALNYLDLKDTNKKILLVQDDEHDLAQIFGDDPELSKIFKDYSPIYNQLLPNVDKVTISSESSLSDYKSSNDLSSYDAVVWYTGNGLGFFSEEGTTLTKTDTDMLNKYLSNGGKLLLSGVNALSGQEKSSFVKDTLHLNVFSDMGPSLNVKGLSGGIYENTNLNVNRFDFPYYFADFIQSNDSKSVINSEYVSDYTQAYDYYSGTSMATPHTTGAAAILLGLHPNMSPEMLKLYTGAKGTKLDSLNGLVGTGKIVKSSTLDNFDDNDAPGIPLDKSVLNGSLDSTKDKNDVYAISLKEGQGITFSLNGQAGSDFDLYVYNESATSVNNKNGMIAYSENVNSSKEKINFIAPRTGIYFVNVYDYNGSGNYKLYSGNFGGSYEDDSNSVTLDGDWMPAFNPQYSEGMAGVLNSRGEVNFSFVGSSIEWQGFKDPSQGIADVYIDGKKISSLSLYNSTLKSKQSLFKQDFTSYGNHSIRIVWTGKNDPAARKSATGINLDKFIVKDNPISLKTSFDTAKKYPVISWTAPKWAESYSIYRKESSQSDYVQLNKTPITTTSYTDTTAMSPGKTYNYVVVINTLDKTETPYSTSINYVNDDDTKARIYISGTAKGSLNTDAKDLNDVWAKNLVAGKTYDISLTGPSSANFDLKLFDIGTSTIYGQKELKKSANTTSTEKIVFKPTKSGMYYIVPTAVKGSGQYSLSLSVQTTKSVENSDSNVKYSGTWNKLNYTSASGGTIHQTKGSTGSLQYNFSGTGITVYALKDKNMGRADVYIDGKKIKQIDLYSSSRKYKVNVFDTQNLPNKAHTIKIVATGTKSSAATNKLINVDSFKLTQFSLVK